MGEAHRPQANIWWSCLRTAQNMRETSCNSSSSNEKKLHQKAKPIFHLFSAKLNKKYHQNPAITARVRRVWDAKGYENCTGCSLAQNRTIATYTYTHTRTQNCTEDGNGIGVEWIRHSHWRAQHSAPARPLYQQRSPTLGNGSFGFGFTFIPWGLCVCGGEGGLVLLGFGVFFFSFFGFCLCASFYGPYFIKRSVCFRHNSFFSCCAPFLPLFSVCLCVSHSHVRRVLQGGRKEGR